MCQAKRRRFFFAKRLQPTMAPINASAPLTALGSLELGILPGRLMAKGTSVSGRVKCARSYSHLPSYTCPLARICKGPVVCISYLYASRFSDACHLYSHSHLIGCRTQADVFGRCQFDIDLHMCNPGSRAAARIGTKWLVDRAPDWLEGYRSLAEVGFVGSLPLGLPANRIRNTQAAAEAVEPGFAAVHFDCPRIERRWLLGR